MFYHDIIIIGGGASGIIAAITAKDLGMDVAIIDASPRICKKLLTTGNGRCNISNNNIHPPFKGYHSENPNFFFNTLSNFNIDDTKNLFYTLGLPVTELENGKLYPQSLQASSVIDIFRMALEERSIPLYLDCKVCSVSKKKNFIISTNNDNFKNFLCKKLILCCGGKSAPKTGSDGSGYKLAKSFGHTIICPVPGIVQLKLDYPYLKALSGVKFNGTASIFIDNNLIRSEEGEILFTDYGISGPPILQLSSYAAKALNRNSTVKIVIDMFPSKSTAEINNLFSTHFSIFNYREISSALIGLINKKLIPVLLKDCNIKDIHIPCSNVDWKDLKTFISRLKHWEFTCMDTNGFSNAQVTVGGVNTKEINSTTLESKLQKNLYFCGEIMDVHGDCGGFNLQWAWSSGVIAAKSASL